jgi:molybdate transport system regulatory protein
MTDVTAGVEYNINVDGNSFLLNEKKFKLLTYINETESITEAAKLTKISYRTALNYIDKMETSLDIAVVSTRKGGSGGGGGTKLTVEGLQILKECKKINAIMELHRETNELEAEIINIDHEKGDMTLKIKDLELTIPLNKQYAVGDKILALISYDNISITLRPHKSSLYKALQPQNSSIRNVLEGTVTELKLKDETVRVRINVSGVDIYADITLSALKDLNLELGKEVFISFKALSIATLKL